MKRQEREHLKEDPFQQFISRALETLEKLKKQIFIGIAAVAGIIVIILLIGFIRHLSISSENELYGKAVTIKADNKLSVDQKIEKLGQLKSKGGVAASVKLMLASLYFEKGDTAKSKELLDDFSSGIKLLNEQKKVLEADIFVATNKKTEALELLNQLLADPKSEIAKDFVLLKMAKIQMKNQQTETAVTNLNKIIDEYPQSYYSYEARSLLTELEKE